MDFIGSMKKIADFFDINYENEDTYRDIQEQNIFALRFNYELSVIHQ